MFQADVPQAAAVCQVQCFQPGHFAQHTKAVTLQVGQAPQVEFPEGSHLLQVGQATIREIVVVAQVQIGQPRIATQVFQAVIGQSGYGTNIQELQIGQVFEGFESPVCEFQAVIQVQLSQSLFLYQVDYSRVCQLKRFLHVELLESRREPQVFSLEWPVETHLQRFEIFEIFKQSVVAIGGETEIPEESEEFQ